MFGGPLKRLNRTRRFKVLVSRVNTLMEGRSGRAPVASTPSRDRKIFRAHRPSSTIASREPSLFTGCVAGSLSPSLFLSVSGGWLIKYLPWICALRSPRFEHASSPVRAPTKKLVGNEIARRNLGMRELIVRNCDSIVAIRAILIFLKSRPQFCRWTQRRGNIARDSYFRHGPSSDRTLQRLTRDRQFPENVRNEGKFLPIADRRRNVRFTCRKFPPRY